MPVHKVWEQAPQNKSKTQQKRYVALPILSRGKLIFPIFAIANISALGEVSSNHFFLSFFLSLHSPELHKANKDTYNVLAYDTKMYRKLGNFRVNIFSGDKFLLKIFRIPADHTKIKCGKKFSVKYSLLQNLVTEKFSCF